ncbi:MAG TPA: DUF1045 domain-containing protein [Burkholderiales bacterium]|nr:DUF1045 domain-containing protein [Burkholderiales bacterium]
MSRRYALYFAPPEHTDLWRLGCAWLGRDPATGRRLRPPAVDGFSAQRIRGLTASPRLYGLHATLKPPFRLRSGCTRDDLVEAAHALAARHAAFALPALEVGTLAGFLALRTSLPSDRLRRLADACAVELDHFRADPQEEELVRRRQAGLTPRQEELLLHLGYPYLLDQWRFHITLTESVAGVEAERLAAWLASYFRAATQPVRCEDICLFVQPAPRAEFQILRRFPLRET